MWYVNVEMRGDKNTVEMMAMVALSRRSCLLLHFVSNFANTTTSTPTMCQTNVSWLCDVTDRL